MVLRASQFDSSIFVLRSSKRPERSHLLCLLEGLIQAAKQTIADCGLNAKRKLSAEHQT